MPHPVTVIVNPASGRGRGARRLHEIRKAFAHVGVGDVRVTPAPREERTLARQAIEEGARTIVVCGGDGTIGNVADTIIRSGADVRLALIAAGTGNDFHKSIGAPAEDPAATARLAVEGPDVRIDVGKIEDRHFLNVCGFGFDIAVLEDIQTIAWLRGPALYNYSALRQLMGYGGVQIDICSAAGPRRARHLMLIIANARHFGGSFRIAPAASVTDGRLDAISIHDASPLRRMRLFGFAKSGRHVEQPEVVSEQADRFTVRFAHPPAYETDGEYNRAESEELTVSCIPRALRVVTPGGEALRA
ncbi:MAG TPA: diacylglycerol kinase family protein [Gemmatimonadaceae bacterium]|nr:diacylglycerol kinase family protein [Gemmatimonadaceae bacterium]